jgi:hypothetical protein
MHSVRADRSRIGSDEVMGCGKERHVDSRQLFGRRLVLPRPSEVLDCSDWRKIPALKRLAEKSLKTGVAASGPSLACLPRLGAPRGSASHGDSFEQSTVLRAGILDGAKAAATRIRQSLFERAQKPSSADQITVRVDRV